MHHFVDRLISGIEFLSLGDGVEILYDKKILHKIKYIPSYIVVDETNKYIMGFFSWMLRSPDFRMACVNSKFATSCDLMMRDLMLSKDGEISNCVRIYEYNQIVSKLMNEKKIHFVEKIDALHDRYNIFGVDIVIGYTSAHKNDSLMDAIEMLLYYRHAYIKEFFELADYTKFKYFILDQIFRKFTNYYDNARRKMNFTDSNQKISDLSFKFDSDVVYDEFI